MRVLFAGTPEFAATALKALLASDHTAVGVLTQPDRPAGRGLKVLHSPVKRLALERGLPLFQPIGLKQWGGMNALSALDPEVLVVAAYGLLLPSSLLQLAPAGALNIHASLLPRWRGAAPIQRAILCGDAQTGISVMQMDVGLDTGGVVLARSCPIRVRESYGSLHDRLADLGSSMLIEVLDGLTKGELTNTPQDSSQATYAAKIEKKETVIDWSAPALEIERRVCAFNPSPGARTCLNAESLKIWEAQAWPDDDLTVPPGTILDRGEGLWVATGQGTLSIESLQRSGGRPMSARALLSGFPMLPGHRLGEAQCR